MSVRPCQPQFYSDEFRDDAVRLLKSTSRPLHQVAKEINLAESTQTAWVKARESGQSPRSASLKVENRALRKENAELKMEKEILKRFSAFFIEQTAER